MPEIKRLSIRHEAIMEWLIANPSAKLAECARSFGVSQPWLSCIIHSDAFKGRYQELIGENIDQRVMPLRNQLTGVAATAIQKLGTAVEASSDPDFLLATVDKTLHRLGYAPQSAQPAAAGTLNQTQINFYSASKEDLERARERRRALYAGADSDDGSGSGKDSPGEILALPASQAF